MTENLEHTGLVESVTVKKNNSGSGSWTKRATIKVGGKNFSTFEVGDIDIANANDGKNVTITYTKNGTFNNMIKQGINPSNGVINPAPVQSTPTQNKPQQQPNNSVTQPSSTQTDWDAIERRKTRSVALSYVKDLVVSDDVELSKMCDVADELYTYVWDGVTPAERAKRLAEKAPGLTSADKIEKAYPGVNQQPVVEEEIIE